MSESPATLSRRHMRASVRDRRVSHLSQPTDVSRAPAEEPPSFHERSMLWKFFQCWIRVIASAMFEFRTYNRHLVPKRGAVLLVCNHQSYLDPPLVAIHLYRPISYLAQAYLFRIPVFGTILRKVHAFPVKQGTGQRGPIDEAIRRLKEGHLLNIYPEGHRSPNGEIQPLQGGATLVARKSGATILPCVIDGSFKAWPRTRWLPRCHRVRVMYGPPLDLEGLRGEEVTRLIDRTLRQMLAELRELVRQEPRR